MNIYAATPDGRSRTRSNEEQIGHVVLTYDSAPQPCACYADTPSNCHSILTERFKSVCCMTYRVQKAAAARNFE